MSLFKNHGKHARGASDNGAGGALPAQADDQITQALGPTAGQADPTAAIGGAPTAQETVAIDAGSVQPASMPTQAIDAQPGAVHPDQGSMAGFDVDLQGYPLNGEAALPDSFVSAVDIPKKKNKRALKAFGITSGVILGALLIAYIVGAVVFMGRFLPNTVIGDHNISLETDEEVIQTLEKAAGSYQFDVVGGSFSYRTTSSQIGMEIDGQAIVEAMHEDLNPWAWPVLIVQQNHDETACLVATYDKAALEADFTEKLKAYNETAQAPVNATIVYNEGKKSFDVKPEEAGTQWDAQSVLEAIDEAVPAMEPKLTLVDEQLVQPTVFSTDEKLIESAQIATGLVSADLVLNMGGQRVGEVNGEMLSDFVTIDDKLDVTFNEDAMTDWVEQLAEGYNTIGTERRYTRADGKEIVVSGGSYGWEIDTDALREALVEGIKSGAKEEIEVPCYSTAAVYNGAGQRDWGARYFDVDISEQHVRLYGDDGSIIWESDCISGEPDGKHDTVPGVWYVNNMESPSKLIGYENNKKIYETTVQYWMAFETSEIGFHDASWQPGFGGDMYAQGYGSHGCVNLPVSAAKELYDICNIGDVVVVHH